ncbi:MAG: hypothetical protein D6753_09510 [Planctomycetota bacterium]|nr:MAG: hypothetical protein D6753_09510 [Planctomycetota bacterium]
MERFLPIVVMIVIGVAFVAWRYWYEKKRRAAIMQFASQLGLSYSPSLLPGDDGVFQRFPISNRGRGRKATDAIVADSGEVRMVIFDYRYTTGSGKNSTTYRQTVALVHVPGLNLPEFALQPESFVHRLGEFFGVKDIDFDDDPTFSKKFLLQGADEEAIRAYMTPQRRRALLEYGDTCIEANGDDFLFYRTGKRAPADQIKPLMERAFGLLQILKEPPGQ